MVITGHGKTERGLKKLGSKGTKVSRIGLVTNDGVGIRGVGLTGGGFELGGEQYGRTLEFPISVVNHTRKGRLGENLNIVRKIVGEV
jgi:hypothetical protein